MHRASSGQVKSSQVKSSQVPVGSGWPGWLAGLEWDSVTKAVAWDSERGAPCAALALCPLPPPNSEYRGGGGGGGGGPGTPITLVK